MSQTDKLKRSVQFFEKNLCKTDRLLKVGGLLYLNILRIFL